MFPCICTLATKRLKAINLIDAIFVQKKFYHLVCSEKITEALMTKLMDKNWKLRNEGLQEVNIIGCV